MTETIKNTMKIFKFSFPTCTNEDLLFKLEVPVEIPYKGLTRELVQRVINMFHIPVYLEDELNEKLATFVAEETKNFHNDRDEKLLNQLKNSELNVDGIVKNWEKLFKDNVIEFAEQKGPSEEEEFAAAYHKLVHSSALETILQVEQSYAATILNTIQSQDEDMRILTERQTEEMEAKVKEANQGLVESEDINALCTAQYGEQAARSGRWAAQLAALAQAQRNSYRAWLMDTLTKYDNQEPLHTPSNSPLATFSQETRFPHQAPNPRLEESFTIHLGSQLKQTHNIRIMVADILDLCSINNLDEWCTGRRPATALSLYGAISACVLCSSKPPGHLRATATDHHFPDLTQQLAHILEKVKEPVEKRNAERMKEQQESGNTKVKVKKGVQTGDVFITKHSNFAEVHVIFHLIVDDASMAGDITSRHPAILGLRNIFKAACCNDITSITFPLLLRHELTEEMTASWCIRRAELVLKCVKGFMAVLAGEAGAAPGTLAAALPPGALAPLFQALQDLLPTIFRTTTPLNITLPNHTDKPVSRFNL